MQRDEDDGYIRIETSQNAFGNLDPVHYVVHFVS